jgi:hypothetical protein
LVDKGKSRRCTCLGSPGCQHTTTREKTNILSE